MDRALEGMVLTGRVETGIGEGAAFTQLTWARRQFVRELGIDPFPGTLNLLLDQEADKRIWKRLKASAGRRVVPVDPGWCDARCYPIRINRCWPGAIVYPEVSGYPDDQIEIIAALPLRERLGLEDGDRLEVAVNKPLEAGALIFDVDGTLVDSLEVYREVAETVAAPHGLRISKEQVRLAMNSGRNFWDLITPAGWPERASFLQELATEALLIWPDVLAVHGRIFDGFTGTLQDLADRGMSLGIVSGSFPGALQPLREGGVMELFSAAITGADVEKQKPDPEGLLKCASLLNKSPEECVYIGDSPLDIQAARSAGMAAVGVLTGSGDSATLAAEGPDWVIYSLANLTEILSEDR